MILGFTGTRKGMTPEQMRVVTELFRELNVTMLCHGGEPHADAQAGRLAKRCGHHVFVEVYPGTKTDTRNCWDADCIHPPKDYLARNRDVVRFGCDGLIACPKDYVDKAGKRGEGTWTTVGYARQAGRRIWIVFPDGTMREEPAR